MKKFVLSVIIMSLFLCVSGCGGVGNATADSKNGNANKTVTTPVASKKILITYFSWSGTTRKLAEDLKTKLGCDIYEIRAKDTYSTSYGDCADRAKTELANNARPALATPAPSLNNYDIIFVGYPIWFDDAPMVIDTFLASANLTGKTVIPFATSGGSGIGTSIKTIKKLIPQAKVNEGRLLHGTGDVSSWLKELGLSK